MMMSDFLKITNKLTALFARTGQKSENLMLSKGFLNIKEAVMISGEVGRS